MKSLHRTKALTAYEAARMALKNDMAYPAYMMLKEAARGTLAYIVEDSQNREISEKTKLQKLLDWANEVDLHPNGYENISYLIQAESKGLSEILTLPLDELNKVKKTIKLMIGEHLRQNV